jgi:hypothetical protein
MKSDSHSAPTSLAAGVICRFIVDIRFRFLLRAEPGEGVENSECAQEPQNHGNNYDDIKDLFDGGRHWYEAVNQP